MRAPDGHRLLETLHLGQVTWVARAVRDSDQRPVICKGLLTDFPTRAHIARLRHEYAMLELAGRAGVRATVLPLELAGPPSQPVIVFPDDAGQPVSGLLGGGRLALPDVVRIAHGTALALAELHRAGIVHRDVKPANLLACPERPLVRIIDLGLAATLATTEKRSGQADGPVGTLAYLAPEQTGRLPCPVDERSDLYSLGAVLFELLTGRPPFTGSDPLALVHAHLAMVAPDVRELRPDVPASLAELVRILLRKSPDERYRTAAGLAVDLESHVGAAPGAPITLRQRDVPDRFRLPTGFYGRGAERAALIGALDVARPTGGAQAAGFALALVSGFSGSGKTALALEVRSAALARGAAFVSGKHDVVQRATPHAALREALADVASQWLRLPDDQLAPRVQRLRDALGPNVGLAARLVPAFHRALGGALDESTEQNLQPQQSRGDPPAGRVDARRQGSRQRAPASDTAARGAGPPEETLGRRTVFRSALEAGDNAEAARQRVRQTLLAMLRGVASAEAPLGVFLDDLQWADPGTFDLLGDLVADDTLEGLLVIAAWRSNEVDAAHPLRLTVDRLPAGDARIVRIEVGPLDDDALAQLVAGTVHRPLDAVRPLAALVRERTQGNPFFARLFLEQLHRDGLLRFEPDRGWIWDAAEVARAGITDNVAHMMAGRLRELPEASRRILGVAAAVGASFRFDLLATTTGLTLGEAWAALWPALVERHVVPHDNVVEAEVPGGELRLQFQHDRVQQGAYEAVPGAERAAVHLRIVRALHGEDDIEPFWLAEHAAKAIPAAEGEEDRARLATLLRAAGRAARGTAAYDVGLRLLDHALTLTSASPAERFEALVDRYVCAFMVGRRDDADERLAELLRAAGGELQQAEVLDLEVGLLASLGRHTDAMHTARVALKLLGMPIPERVGQLQVVLEVVRLKAALAFKKPGDVAALPDAPPGAARLVPRIVNSVAASAYFLDTNLYTVLSLRLCRYTLRHGVSPHAGFAWACYALVAGPILGDYPASAAWSDVSRRLHERFGRIEMLPRLSLNLDGLVDPWTRPPRASLPRLEAAVRAGVHAGDPLYAAFCANQITYLELLAGLPLVELHRDSLSYEAFCRRQGIAESPETFVVTRLFAERLMGFEAPGETLLPGAAADAAWAARLEAMQLKIPVHIHAIATGFLHLLAGRHAAAVTWAERADRWTDKGISTGYSSLGPLTRVLGTLFALNDAGSEGVRPRVTWGKALSSLTAWAKANPAGFEHRAALIAAERARLDGDRGQAVTLYERAVELAARGGFLHEEGLACLRAASYYEALGNRRVAAVYRRGAASAWDRWGATALAQGLRQSWPELTREPTASLVSSSSSPGGETMRAGHNLDITTVLRAAEALTREIDLDELIARLLQLLVESAGARRAVLLLLRDGELFVEGEIATGQNAPRLRSGERAADRRDLGHSLVRYALRTRVPGVLAGREGERDEHLAPAGVRSAAAIPIASGGALQGVVYLENDLVAGAFGPERIALLEALSGQIAISLRNAQLYKNLGEQATALRRFVPEEFLNMLGRHDIATVQLGDAVESNLTVLFSDLRGFTSFSESRPPGEVFQFLNRYLGVVGPIIRRHGGFIDKYIGDAVMALFPGDPVQAIRAGVAMHEAVHELNRELDPGHGLPLLRVGVGVHEGRLTLGVLGEQERRETTVIGDAVNTAARLESATKRLGTDFLVGGSLARRLPVEIPARPLGALTLPGRQQPVEVHEVLAHFAPDQVTVLQAVAPILAQALRDRESGDFAAARAAARAVLAEAPFDRAAAALERSLDTGGPNRPPDPLPLLTA